MSNEKRLIDAYLNGEVPKIKTHFAEIIVRGKTEKPYYNIIFIDPQTREYEVCFGSYSLENVRKWLSEEFEIVDAPTVDAVALPCKIGDYAYAIRNYKGHIHPKRGIVSDMYFIKGMKLCVVVHGIGRGEWGKEIFGTEEEAYRAIEERKRK
jgi:hypothetical protein